MDWAGRRSDLRFLRMSRTRDPHQMLTLEKIMQFKGKFLLDPVSISALLILMFVNIPPGSDKKSKLQKLMRNLCCHQATRQWIVQSLLEILEKAKESVNRYPDDKDAQLSLQFAKYVSFFP